MFEEAGRYVTVALLATRMLACVLNAHWWSHRWQFVDSCWAAGTIEWRVGVSATASAAAAGDTNTQSDCSFSPDVRYRKRLTEQFWLMSPERAIADHCPEDEAWQLLVSIHPHFVPHEFRMTLVLRAE